MTVHALPVATRAKRQAVPLRVGDVWVYIGPATEVRIVALAPRPTLQRPKAHAVTLSDGTTIAESTLRFAYMRRQEYRAEAPIIEAKARAACNEYFGIKAPVIPIRGRA